MDLRIEANGVTPIPAAIHMPTSYSNMSVLAVPNGPSTDMLKYSKIIFKLFRDDFPVLLNKDVIGKSI